MSSVTSSSADADLSTAIKFRPLRRAARKLTCELKQVQFVTLCKRAFADTVLLGMVIPAQADHPSVRRLECHATVGAPAHVCAFDRHEQAPRDRAVVTAHPRPVRRTNARAMLATGTRAMFWKTNHAASPPAQLHWQPLRTTGCVGAAVAGQERYHFGG